MIYDPRPIFDLRLALLAGIFRALTAAAQDFIAEENKPWTYYLGMGFGGTAIATGGVGLAATMYAVGESVDLLLFRSPEGSSVDLFLDGVLYSTVDLFVDSSPEWFTQSVIGLTPGILHRIDLVNGVNTNPAKTSPINWLGIGTISVNGTGAYAQKATSMATYNVSYSILDSDGDSDTLSIKLLDGGQTLAQVVEAAQDFAVLVNNVSDGQITDIAVTLSAALPGGLRNAPVAGSENQRGATFSFTLTGSPYRDSVRVPNFAESMFSGKNVDLDDPAVVAFRDALLNGIVVTSGGGATLLPSNRFEFQYAGLASAVKSFRK